MNYIVLLLVTVSAVRAVVQIDTVPQLNLTQYVGRWYQVYDDRTTEYFIEEGCYCSLADYGLSDNGSITIRNTCRRKAPNGTLHTVSGLAYRPDPDQQGKFIAKLTGISALNYWVIQLGPATFNKTLYQYSVVSDPDKLQLIVLARNVTGFMIDYAEKVRLQLHYQGFTNFLNKPIVTYQGSDCKYPF